MAYSNGICGRVVTNPDGRYNEEKRFWQGCPTIARTPGGILYAGWYTGGTREPSAFHTNLLVKSCDNGKSWSNVILAIDSAHELNVRAIDIQLWIDPQKRLWLFWTTRDDNFTNVDQEHLKVWAIICDDPDAETPVWSEPRYVTQGFLRCQPAVLGNGRILLCSYDWTCDHYRFSISDDHGETWQRKTGGRKINTPFDETMAVERLDGSIWMLARSTEKALAQSFSYDGAETWTDGEVSDLTAPSSRFFIKRMPSGNLLLIRNLHETERTMLTASLSDDDGVSWKWSMLIDPDMNISYPDAAIDENGVIYMVHDHGRNDHKEILFSRFTEEDIISGKCASADSFVKHIISKLPEHPVDQEEFERFKTLDAQWKIEDRKRNSRKS